MKATLFTLSNATVNAINEMNAACNSCRTRVFPKYIMIYGNVTFADGRKSFVNTQGKDIDTAEKNFLRCVIKRAVPESMFEETCAKYNITPDAFNRKAKAEIQVEAKADINVEAKTEVVVEKQAPAAVVVEIPRLETVRQSRSPKKLKAQKISDGVAEILPAAVKHVAEKNNKARAEFVESLQEVANVIPMTISKEKRDSFEQAKHAIIPVGNKKFAWIPLNLLFADKRFQRIDKAGGLKVRKLVEKWDDKKCDPLRVSMHSEECMFSVIDGLHRYTAADIKGFKGVICEILDMPENPEERLKEEARIFATQNDELERLSLVDKHLAYIIIGDEAHTILDNVLKRYNIPIKANKGGGRVKNGHLAAYGEALNIANAYGEKMLDNVFKIICESRWNLAHNGFNRDVFRSLRNVFALHPDHVEEIISEAIKMFKPIEPVQFFGESMTAYPGRNSTERTTLYLEDYLCDKIGMERVYLANKGIERHSTINAEVPVGVSAS